jgi:hypothetical protein
MRLMFYAMVTMVPFAVGLVQPAHAHLTPTHHPLNDAKHRLHRLLAQAVEGSPGLRAQLVRHALERVCRLGRWLTLGEALHHRQLMTLALDCQQRLDVRVLKGSRVDLAAHDFAKQLLPCGAPNLLKI